VVVTLGDTDRLVTDVTSPTALSIDRLVAPDVVHDKLEDWPAVIPDGVAAKLAMVGNGTLEGAGLLESPPPHATSTEIKGMERNFSFMETNCATAGPRHERNSIRNRDVTVN
jgi:hypothetical protein